MTLQSLFDRITEAAAGMTASEQACFAASLENTVNLVSSFPRSLSEIPRSVAPEPALSQQAEQCGPGCPACQKLELAQTLLRREYIRNRRATPEECEVLGVSLYFSIEVEWPDKADASPAAGQSGAAA